MLPTIAQDKSARPLSLVRVAAFPAFKFFRILAHLSLLLGLLQQQLDKRGREGMSNRFRRAAPVPHRAMVSVDIINRRHRFSARCRSKSAVGARAACKLNLLPVRRRNEAGILK